MIVEPYKRPPAPPTMALLTREGEVHTEDRRRLEPEQVEKGTRVFAAWETVYALTREGRGEALCWNGEEIRWRPVADDREAGDWKASPQDVFVLKIPLEGDPLEMLAELVRWRDWLAIYGASPTGTTGSTAVSLLRSRLERRLVTGQGVRPPLLQTLGGRQELGPAGAGRYSGTLAQIDLPAAYARELGGLRYGGWWLEETRPAQLERHAALDLPVFVRARVRVPALAYGPLPKRPTRRMRSYLEAVLLGSSYPTGGRLQGVWTWQELEAAVEAGVHVERIVAGWVHRSGWTPFAPWWEAVQDGRSMRGLAGALAKMTGNALWGRFAMDPRAQGLRTVRRRRGAKLTSRPLRARPFQWPAHDLAETVSGRTRARLYRAMAAAGDLLVSAHTDGLWVADESFEPDGWRRKERARRLELLTPQVLRYWPAGAEDPTVVFAGVPAERAPEAFAAAWQEAGFS